MNLQTNVAVPSPETRPLVIERTKGAVVELFKDIGSAMLGPPPTEWTYGAIVGYLRARGYSWTDALTAMDEYLRFTVAENPLVPEARHAFRMELITCSVGCADFLKTCLERNMRYFDRVLVVTDPKDEVSCNLARSMGADVLVTDRFYAQGKRFDRGSSYNRALKELRFKDWVAFMDVDIVLPREFRALVEAHGLRNDCFYGMARRDISSDNQREAFLAGQPFESTLHTGSDWGFGFFQLFNMNSCFLKDANPIYPANEDVNHSDYLFRKQFGRTHQFDEKTGVWNWDPVYQIKLPFECFHLGANKGEPSLTRHYPNPHNLSVPLSLPSCPSPVVSSSPVPLPFPSSPLLKDAVIPLTSIPSSSSVT